MTNLRAQEAERAAQMFQKKREAAKSNESNFFDQSSSFATASNSQVANILDKNAPIEEEEKKTE